MWTVVYILKRDSYKFIKTVTFDKNNISSIQTKKLYII